MQRREANQNLVLMALGLAAPAAIYGCSKKPDCNDVSTLSPDELRLRTEIAKYVEQTPDAQKRCSGCSLYVAAGPEQCGGCTVVKGPIHPNGYCTLFVVKPPS